MKISEMTFVLILIILLCTAVGAEHAYLSNNPPWDVCHISIKTIPGTCTDGFGSAEKCSYVSPEGNEIRTEVYKAEGGMIELRWLRSKPMPAIFKECKEGK